MKKRTKKPGTRRDSRLLLRLRYYGSYVDEARQLEGMLGKRHRTVRIDMVGSGEIPPDSALLIRSILLSRSPRTRIITHARSSLLGASVLVWLLGDTRLIRDDARLYFRSAGLFDRDADETPKWRDRSFFDDDELEEADYIQVLHAINQFLPVKELAGFPIERPVLQQFGLVDNEKVDRWLTAAFRKSDPVEQKPAKMNQPSARKPDDSI